MSKDESASDSAQSAPKTPDSGSSGGSGEESKEGSILPAVVAGAGLLLVAGVLMFSGGDDGKTAAADKGDKAARDKSAKNAGAAGGVGGRNVDDAEGASRKKKPKVNPRIENAVVFGSMAEAPIGEKGPPDFESKEEELEWWEDRLNSEQSQLAMREKAVQRLPKTRDQLEKRDPDNFELEFERKKAIVENNLAEQQKKVAEVEAKLEELRG